MFKITGSAHDFLLSVLEREEDPLYVRVTMGIGWGGPQLKLSLEEQPLKGDEIYEFGDIKILIHERDYVYFDHTKLDYVTDVLGKGKLQLIKI